MTEKCHLESEKPPFLNDNLAFAFQFANITDLQGASKTSGFNSVKPRSLSKDLVLIPPPKFSQSSLHDSMRHKK